MGVAYLRGSGQRQRDVPLRYRTVWCSVKHCLEEVRKMQGTCRWYILFVRAGSENRTISDFKKAFELKSLPYSFDIFYPEAEQYYRGKRYRMPGRSYLRRPLFPGYLFIETDMPASVFLPEFSDFIYRSADIIRLLRDTSGGIALPESEQERLGYLLRGKRCLEHSVGYIAGDRIVVTAGPLKGREAIIQKINRHNRDAYIELELFGDKMTLKIALEIVTKQKQDDHS